MHKHVSFVGRTEKLLWLEQISKGEEVQEEMRKISSKELRFDPEQIGRKGRNQILCW